MKQTTKLTLCAIMAALATAVMMISFFPYLTYAIPAMAGLFIMITVIEINCKWALGTYIASAFLVFLFGDIESKLLYIAFFGYYPIVKALLERIRKPVIEWIIKSIIFNSAVLVVYFFFAPLFGIPLDSFEEWGKIGAVLLLILGNVVFVLYDIAVSRMAFIYFKSIHQKINKFLK